MASADIAVSYNRDLKPLETLLAKVRRPGDFFVSGAIEIPMPRIEVKSHGVLSFPVPDEQARTLAAAATPAPYGRGEKTLLDETVRKVRQLPPDSVSISGKSWTATFASLLETVAAGLGCPFPAARAELYKLLVYEDGGFFKSHRDTEKAQGMFGTLVVVLPSPHEGGELIVRHAGREVRADLGATEASEIRYAAFYADCEHEVLPIRRGHRVCLVFNLIAPGPSRSARLTAPDYADETESAIRLLRQAFRDDPAPAKLTWLLEHK